MATMREVADRAEVSVATVSRVINKTGYVSPDLESRVYEAMRALKYQPSALARSLRRRETMTIGVLIPQINQPFYSTLTFSVEKSLFSNDYRTLICSSEQHRDKENAYIEMLLRQRVDGVVLVPTGKNADSFRQFQDHNIPVVLADHDVPSLDCNKVLSDNYRGGYIGMKHLIELGHRHIGLIGGPDYSQPMNDRLRGVQSALAEYKLTVHAEMLAAGPFHHFEVGYNSAMGMLRQSTPPTAIFALTDMMAIGVLHAAAELDLTLPQDLSVVGYDDIPLSAYSIPGLTTIAQPTYEMGQVVTRILLDAIQNPDHTNETHLLSIRLIMRESTAPPR